MISHKTQIFPKGNNQNDILPKKPKDPPFFISARFLISVVMLFGYMINYLQRTNMSIAVVCMVNSTAVQKLDESHLSFFHHHSNESINSKCLDRLSKTKSDGKFVWSKADQGLILAAYFYGYLLTQIPGGWLSQRFGGRLVIFISILIPSILTIATPPIANLNSPTILIVVRFLIGFFHGLMFPAMASVFAQWAPTHEKSRLLGFSQAGTNIGCVVSSIFGGYLCENGFYEGWGSIFILFGGVGVVWVMILLFLTSDSPIKHRFINKWELDYITTHVPHVSGPKRVYVFHFSQKEPRLKTPWKAIFTSKACLSTFLANFCTNWGSYLFLTQTPTYMKDVLKFDIKANGIYSSFPFLAAYFIVITSSYASDKLISSRIISVKYCRRVFNSLGMFLPMVMIISLGFVDCSQPMVAVGLLTFGLSIMGCVVGSGYVVNINDIGGRNYSGVLYGISNTFGTLPGIIAPYFVGLITTKGTVEEWRIVFFVTAAVCLIGGIPYAFFAQGDVEEWAVLENEGKTNDSETGNINSSNSQTNSQNE